MRTNGYRRGGLLGSDDDPDDLTTAAGVADGELTVLGRIRSASNATFLCEADAGRQHRALRVQADRR